MWLLRRLQASLVPEEVRRVVGLRRDPFFSALLRCYRYLPGGGNKLRWLHAILLPRRYAQQLSALSQLPASTDQRSTGVGPATAARSDDGDGGRSR